ncbi:outer membrane receptor protein involved in Fe transport [Idiomarina fontislapidosi]|uniref:TonB-dependent receptor n=1 Tax=Idiomarina fontislapidosi TaxID=263723 RepID=A0A432Y7U7_9GAMM|nr:TonB-dependent receptor [Idiomarina fontislapidosi]PYE32340.1 outer membrane receptor protein involved in Fe transport [Idiomarina fontislapidosi]RUO57044.1 hypothetical protein CWE25_05045 [Idiomarina fontislapidosi]
MHNNKFKLSALLLGLLSSTSAWAQAAAETIDESIEVVGDFQKQTITETTRSIAIVDENAMQQRASRHLQDVLNSVANVNFSGGSNTARFIQIRGIGERSQFVDAINPSVGLVIDGIDYSGLGSAATLFDVGQVEVYRGPQSGRFGVNGLAGMVLLESNQPTEATSGEWLIGVGNYSESTLAGAVGGSLGVLGNARLSLMQFDQNGYTENTFLNRDDTEQRDEFTARLSIDTQLGQDWLLKTRIHKVDVDNGYDAFSLENDRTTLSDEPGFDRLDSTAARLQLDYSGFENFTIETAVNVLSADKDYAFDEDWTYVGIAPGWEYSSFDAYYRERDDFTAELRMTSDKPTALWGLPTDWTAGVYYYSKDVQLTRDYFNWDIGSPSIFGSQYETHNQAIYGELVQQLNEAWSWIGGLRIERYDNDYMDSNDVVAEPSDTMVGGNLSLRYQYAPQSYAYATLARGYKAGGVNGEALGRAKDQQLDELEAYLLERATFAPEILWNAEVGVKASQSDWSYRVAAFYNWRDDVQLKSWVNRNQSFVGYIENAAQGSNYGVEAELRYRLNEGVSAFASLGWLDTEIDGFVTEDGMDMSGREQAHAPNYQANIGFEGQLTNALSWSLQTDLKDGFYFSNSHNQQADSMALVHAQLNYDWHQWRFTLWGRNLTDEDYEIRGFYFGNDPRDEYVTETYVQYGEPRRFGLTARYTF